jgi:putative photosynthetic complex assembly protein
MSYVIPEEKNPPFIRAAIFFLLLSILGYSINLFFLDEKTQSSNQTPSVVKVLKFEDLQDGGVAVIDTSSNQVIHVVTGEAGFVRGILRTIARERRIRGLGKDEPVRLMSFKDGRLVLHDPLTNTQIELESFGSMNVESFRVFLKNKNS